MGTFYFIAATRIFAEKVECPLFSASVRRAKWACDAERHGYRIGLDVGNGNIGWCVLFEDRLRLCFLTPEDIITHNAGLPKNEPRIQRACAALR